MIPVILGAARFQLQTFRHNPECLMAMLLVPFQTVVFMSLVRYADRPELTGYAILAPAVIAVMMMAILESGELISRDRGLGTFEALLALPVSIPTVILIRTGVVTLISLLAIGESWLTASLLFGATVEIAHLGVFLVTLLATAVGVAGAATTMSATFILSRSARTFQNSISYPILLLGGAFVPVDLLPGWLQPISRVVFLSWSTDLLRDSLNPAPMTAVAGRLAMVVLLGAAMFGVGLWIYRIILRRVRTTGEVSFA